MVYNRSSRLQMFCIIDVHRNFAKFAEKYPFQGLFGADVSL